ncbi:MAG: hypothetical protein IKK70_05060 [Clostridia bacterium]|nr:hypothetical protein [Clostridia bacterium]
MKRILLLGLCFLLFIVAYGCAQGDDAPSGSTSSAGLSSGKSNGSIEDSGSELYSSDGSTGDVGDSSSAASESDGSSETDDSSEGDASGEDNTSSDVESTDNGSDVESSIEDSDVDSSIEDSDDESSIESSDVESSDDPTPPDDESSDDPTPPDDESSDDPTPPDDESSDDPTPPDDESSDDPTPPDDESSDDPTPPDESEDEDVYTDAGDAELLDSGYILYNGAAYHSTSYKPEVAQAYADTYALYAQMFPDVRISVVTPPQSAINIKNPYVSAMTNDQGVILDNMESHIYGNVNFVNLRKTFEAHKGEYMYFKSDYHWTQLGAYYAYSDFAKSIGLTPTPLSSFDVTTVSTSFIGRTNDYAHDDRILSFYDTIYAYMPRKTHTMTVHNSDLSVNRVFSNCIHVSRDSYSCFINGDNPYTVINVPSNDQSKTALVIKESSGNAFVPFLTEHYGNIIVIDPRHINIDLRTLVAEKGVDDIIFHATASTCSRTAYNDYYRALIGQ